MKNKENLIIKNARIIDPASGFDSVGDIHIKDGVIVSLGECITNSEGIKEIDATGLIAAPGLVDVHVHFRDPGFEYKEDIFSGARAAAAGGYTSVVMMANTKPAIDNVETLKEVLKKAEQTDINVYTCADITVGLKGDVVTDMSTLKASGAVGFTDDGIPLKKPETVVQAMKKAAPIDMPLSFHEEDPAYISQNGINAGEASKYYGIEGSPRQAEISLIDRDIKLASEQQNTDEGCPDIVIQHISTAEGVDLIRQARINNKKIHAEACPHHFTLTEKDVIKHGSLAKMNPPLRTEDDKQAIINGLSDDTIEIISTDHAPHSIEEKNKPITEAPSGIIGLETALGLAIRELVIPGHLSIGKLVEKMSLNPATLYKLNAGRLTVGCPGDLVLFNADEAWTVPDHFFSKSVNSPFVGEKLYGKIYMTICGGKIVYEK